MENRKINILGTERLKPTKYQRTAIWKITNFPVIVEKKKS